MNSITDFLKRIIHMTDDTQICSTDATTNAVSAIVAAAPVNDAVSTVLACSPAADDPAAAEIVANVVNAQAAAPAVEDPLGCSPSN